MKTLSLSPCPVTPAIDRTHAQDAEQSLGEQFTLKAVVRQDKHQQSRCRRVRPPPWNGAAALLPRPKCSVQPAALPPRTRQPEPRLTHVRRPRALFSVPIELGSQFPQPLCGRKAGSSKIETRKHLRAAATVR